MSQFFLSYRRDDSAGFAGRLADRLEAAFGAGSVFRDVDDIRPGEDFQTAIHDQLAAVDAVLVMIGPRWLDARTSAGRRLDDAADFVRLEIATALDSGKPVIPVLVGGALMPAEADLPAPLAGLARRQAVVLSDGGWQGDVSRLIASLGPGEAAVASPAGKPRRWIMGAVAALLGLILIAWLIPNWRATAPEPPVVEKKPADIAGRWNAKVKYPWGDEHDEVFEFKHLGGKLHGTASYLTGRLSIEQASLEGEWLRFVTRSQEMLGSDQPWKEVTHRYTGQVTPEGIRFTLESGGGYTVNPPVEFIARRIAAKPAP
jgi:hypothetical protein